MKMFNASEVAEITGLPRGQVNLLLARNEKFGYELPVQRVPVGARHQALWSLADVTHWFLFARLLEGGIAPATAAAVVRLVSKGVAEYAPGDPPRFAIVDLMAAPALECAVWVDAGASMAAQLTMTNYVIDVYAVTEAVSTAVRLLPALEAARGRKLGRIPNRAADAEALAR